MTQLELEKIKMNLSMKINDRVSITGTIISLVVGIEITSLI